MMMIKLCINNFLSHVLMTNSLYNCLGHVLMTIKLCINNFLSHVLMMNLLCINNSLGHILMTIMY